MTTTTPTPTMPALRSVQDKAYDLIVGISLFFMMESIGLYFLYKQNYPVGVVFTTAGVLYLLYGIYCLMKAVLALCAHVNRIWDLLDRRGVL